MTCRNDAAGDVVPQRRQFLLIQLSIISQSKDPLLSISRLAKASNGRNSGPQP